MGGFHWSGLLVLAPGRAKASVFWHGEDDNAFSSPSTDCPVIVNRVWVLKLALSLLISRESMRGICAPSLIFIRWVRGLVYRWFLLCLPPIIGGGKLSIIPFAYLELWQRYLHCRQNARPGWNRQPNCTHRKSQQDTPFWFYLSSYVHLSLAVKLSAAAKTHQNGWDIW